MKSDWSSRPVLRRVVAAVVLAILFSPALRDRDSYPLSTYPVYATARERTGVLNTAVGIGPNNEQHRLSLQIVAETDDPLIAEDRVSDAVRDGRAEALCTAIAERASVAVADGRIPQTNSVEVVAEEVDFVAMVSEDAPAIARTVHARCEVSR